MKLIHALPLLALAACGDKEGGSDDDTGTSGLVDADGDGFDISEDCDDADADVNPSASEVCDGLDNDCNGAVDDGVATAFYADSDGDGFGGSIGIEACEAPDGFVADNTDCDDLDATVSPDGTEVCDGVDNDCDGAVDDDDDSLDASGASTFYQDDDGDGYGLDDSTVDACSAPSGYAEWGGDCDDANADLSPATVWYSDIDQDGYGSPLYTTEGCEQPSGYVADDSDCDDLDASVNPDGSEVCDDGVDNDCDGLADDADDSLDMSTTTDFYPDVDEDGWGDDAGTATTQCEAPSGYVAGIGDCDDSAVDVNPDATEVCGDGIDNDCDTTANGCGVSGTVTEADADWTISGGASSNMGYDMAFGDIDGDGTTDLVLPGYYGSSESTGASSGGATYLVYGGLSGSGSLSLGGDDDASFSGDGSYDYAGKAVAAGDLNGDGYDDILVSAYSADTTYSSSGSVYLMYGSATAYSGDYTLESQADAEWHGGASSDYLGTAVKVIGDLNDDGYDDFAMGAYSADPGGNSSAGAVYIMYGSASALSGGSATDADVVIAGSARSDNLGYYRNISDPADTDGDGVNDLIIAAKSADPGGNSSAGTVYLMAGDSGISGSYDAGDADALFNGSNSSDYLGEGVAAGDLNGDGYDDVIAGADGHDGSDSGAGAVFVFLGSGTQFSGTYDAETDADAAFTGANAYDALGEGVAAGDANGDGIADLFIGADGYDSTSSSTGAGYLFYGGSLSGVASVTTADATVAPTGLNSYSYGGQSLYIEDTNGDGVGDLWFAAYGDDTIMVFNGGGM